MSNVTGSALSFYEAECPAGLGSSACGQATCDSPFLSPDTRTVKPAADTTCSTCTTGFEGFNCNICSSAAGSCAAARAAVGAKATLPLGSTIVDPTYNGSYTYSSDALVCHKQPDTITTTYVNCDIQQPTLSSLFGGANFTMTLIKVAQPDNTSMTGLPSWEGAQAGTTLSQVWLDGQEQFYCQSTGCSSSNASTPIGSTASTVSNATAALGSNVWSCETTECHCSANSTFCGSGATVGVNLGNVITGLSGTLVMPCNYVDSASGDASGNCQFQSEMIAGILGSNGIPLVNCQFGSCVSESQQNYYYRVQDDLKGNSSNAGTHLSGPIKGAVAVLAVVVAALLGFLLWGCLSRRRAKSVPRREDGGPPVGISWEHISYVIDGRKGAHSKLGGRFARSQGSSAEEGAAVAAADSTEFGASPSHGGAAAQSLKDHTILRDVSGHAPAGHLIAVLGPSGAGKTTLVELLAGRDKMGKMTGDVKLQSGPTAGGHGSSSEKSSMEVVHDFSAETSGRRLFAFVDQEDQLPEYSTVREALAFAAELSLPENVTSEEKANIVEATMHTVGLDAIKNRLIGSRRHRGISGGEKRRVSIGIALVARPRILVLDEPLSGLDAYNAARVIAALRALAYKGDGSTTVILTLHQPSSDIFYKFDRSIFLAKGKTFYDGAPDEALQWCAQQNSPCPPGYNVADHLLYLSSEGNRQGGTQRSTGLQPRSSPYSGLGQTSAVPGSPAASALSSNGEKRAEGHEITTLKAAPLRGSATSTTWFTQSLAISRRYLRNITRDSAGPIAHLGVHIAVGLFVGGAFFKVQKTIGGFQNRIGSLFFLYTLMLFASLSAITYMASVRALMVRERADGLYSAFAWLAAHLLYDLLLLRIVPGICLSIIVYWMVGLHADVANFFEFLLISVIFYIVVSLYMMTLGAVFEDLSIAVLLGGGFVLFNIGFAGFMLNLNTLPEVVKWVQWISPMKYALEAVTINEINGLTIEDSLSGVPFDVPASSIANSLFGLTGSYYRDLLVLALAFTFGFAAILTLAVWQKMKDRR